MSQFRKKPVVIEAVQLRWDTWSDVCELIGPDGFAAGVRGVYLDTEGKPTPEGAFGDEIACVIPTLEGEMLARQNDWIIRGTRGELYPCKPEMFADTFEPVEQYQEA